MRLSAMVRQEDKPKRHSLARKIPPSPLVAVRAYRFLTVDSNRLLL